MTFLCMTALRNQTVAHTFLPLFDHANSSLCQERLFTGRSMNFATMVTRCNISPLYCQSLLKVLLAAQNWNLFSWTKQLTCKTEYWNLYIIILCNLWIPRRVCKRGNQPWKAGWGGGGNSITTTTSLRCKKGCLHSLNEPPVIITRSPGARWGKSLRNITASSLKLGTESLPVQFKKTFAQSKNKSGRRKQHCICHM